MVINDEGMLSLNGCKKLVRQLVREKGFPNDRNAYTQKLLWAFTELGETSDAYKKGDEWKKVFEELIDVVFYLVDFAGLVEQEEGIDVDLDKIFLDKWNKNMSREDQYGQRRDIIQKTWSRENDPRFHLTCKKCSSSLG